MLRQIRQQEEEKEGEEAQGEHPHESTKLQCLWVLDLLELPKNEKAIKRPMVLDGVVGKQGWTPKGIINIWVVIA